jgi:mRNA interferase MazF
MMSARSSRSFLTAARGTRFECSVDLPFLKSGAFDSQGIVTVPAVRLLRRLGGLSIEQMNRVERSLMEWLGLRE